MAKYLDQTGYQQTITWIKGQLDGKVDNDTLSNYATKSDIASVYKYKGSVADLTALQAIENPTVGDVYNIESTGMNAAWTGSAWDDLGSIVDLSDYALKSEVAGSIEALSTSEIDAILNPSANKDGE